jgi:dephospho-CoA kinase
LHRKAKKVKIIGLAGTFASGKDTVGELLSQKHGFMHVSTGDILRAEKKKQYGDSPKALLVRNDPFAMALRKEKGPGALVELAYDEYRKNEKQYPGGLVASGIRSIGEAEMIQKLGGMLIFVDADAKIRYNRAFSRKRDDNDVTVSFDDFLASEKAESDNPTKDKTAIDIPEMKKMANVVIMNNGNSIPAFKKEVEETLGIV